MQPKLLCIQSKQKWALRYNLQLKGHNVYTECSFEFSAGCVQKRSSEKVQLFPLGALVNP